MSAISIVDENGKTILTSDLQGEGLGRYFREAASLRSLVAITRALSKPVVDQDGARTLKLVLDNDLPVGTVGELSVNAGANVGIGLHEPGTTIFAGSDLQAPVSVPAGTMYTSITLEALLKAGISSAPGAISFGFDQGTALRYGYFHPVDTGSSSPTVGDAIRATLGAAVIPADVDDVARLPVGGFVSLAGEGEISFTGKATLSSSANFLATPGLPLVGSLALVDGAELDVDASWTATGEFELRVSRPQASRARVSFHRRKGRSLSVSATATAGFSATVGGRELLGMLMKAISRNPEVDLLALVNAGLSDEHIETIQRAIAASIDRSLTLAAQLQLSALHEDEAMFAYDIDLAALGEQHKSAIREALHGRLGPIDAIAAQPGAPVRAAASVTRQLRQRHSSWRINVLGILNVAGVFELLREGSVTFDPVSGALTAADKVTARRIRVAGQPLQSDGTKLRKVLLESVMVTAAYQASGALGPAVSLSAEQIYVEQHSRTQRRELEDQYRVLVALGLCDAAERDTRLGAQVEFGNSTFTVQSRFDRGACDAMFLGPDERPRSMGDYESIARQALLAVLPADDPLRAFRRVAIASDEIWSRARDLGGSLDASLPDQIRHDPLRLSLVRGDVATIVWWASAMSKAAGELAEMRTFLAQRDPSVSASGQDFVKARAKLSQALGGVAAATEARFDDPWDVLAMDAAASGHGRLEAIVLSSRFAARYADADERPAPALTGGAPRAARASLATRGAPPARDWTDDERAIFSRHVVNLRGGRLSTSGSVTSSEEQLQRLFREHIPEYARRQKALGRRPRVLFFAHGGLTEERKGLLPVLASRRFWDLNGVHPVYFVWETGLLETVRDLVLGAVAERAALGALTDAAIEAAARAGGRVVWGRMKSSAEHSAASDGGAALVATLAGRLWADMRGEIEFHAVGHSAGAIFHAFFLPLLTGQRPQGVPPVTVRSLHLLAPAMTTDLFKTRLRNMIGAGQPIAHLTTYTMTDQLEQADASTRPYRKSLLYLVSQAFEDTQPTPILGLQKSLTGDLQLIRFFGLAGGERVADIAFSKTGDAAPFNARTQSITHGGFDNDVPTMTSIVRRVLDTPEGASVVDYFEEAVPGFDRPEVGVVPPAVAGV